MRRLLVALVLVGIVGCVAVGGRDFWEATQSFIYKAPAAYQRFTSVDEGALLMNTTGGPVTGLRVTFSSPIAPVTGQGIGADVSVASNAGGVVVFAGDIPAYGTVYVVWPLGSAEILSAEWLQGDAIIGVVDLHVPMAVISGQSSVSMTFSITPQLLAEVWATGDLSRSPDGSPIVRYLWEWGDGTSQEGADISRSFVIELEFDLWQIRTSESVTLTVWNAAGGSSSVTHAIPIVLEAGPAT